MHTVKTLARLVTGLIASTLGISALGSDLPSVLNFQGRVSRQSIPFTGQGQFKFALVDTANHLVWMSAPDQAPADGEPDTSVPVRVTDGHYQVRLGEDMPSLPNSLFATSKGLKLRVWFDDGAQGFQLLSPDTALPSVSRAHRSSTADTAARAEVASTAEVATTVAENPTFAGDNTFTGPVGIGTHASPSTLLQVAGAVRSEHLSVHRSFVTMWGEDEASFGPIAASLGEVVKVALAAHHGLALREDGTVFEWGTNAYWKPVPPAGLRDVVAIDAGVLHSLAVKTDGTVVAWGFQGSGLTEVPAGLNHVVAVACGAFHNLALKSDGTVVAWGWNYSGQLDVPSNLRNVVAIAARGEHSLALKADGTVVTWGSNATGENVPPPGLNQVTAIACGSFFNLALKSDGTVVSWGEGRATVPRGLRNVVAIACGNIHSLALQTDGTVVAWGDNAFRESIVPPGLDHAVGLAAGGYTSAVLRSMDLDDLALSSAHPHFVNGLNATVTGSQIAIQGQSTDNPGWAGFFEGRTYLASPVGIGNISPVAPLDILGEVRVEASTLYGGVIVAGQRKPASLSLRTGSQERGVLGMAYSADQFSTDAESGDLVLRTTSTANPLLLQNGDGSAAVTLRNQRLGIGVSNPDAPVSLRRDTANAEFGYCLALNDRDGTPLWKLGADNSRNFSIGAAGRRDRDIAINRDGGDVRISKNLQVNGTVNAAGFHQTSDVRRKTDVTPLTHALSRIEGLRGVRFAWKQDDSESVAAGPRQLGFLAQEVATVLPELVRTNADGFMSMNYAGVTPVLVEAVKELKHTASTQLVGANEQLASIEERLARLERIAGDRKSARAQR